MVENSLAASGQSTKTQTKVGQETSEGGATQRKDKRVWKVIASVLLWLVRWIMDVLKWALVISVVGLWFGFWHFVGWDVARTLVPVVLESLGR